MLKKIILFTLILFSVRLAFSITIPGRTKSKNLIPPANSPANDTTIINIKINNGRLASFYYTDEFGDTDPPCFLSAKDHVKKINIGHPTLLVDSYHQIPFLIYPGEKLTLQVDNDGLPGFTVEGNEIRNNELYFFVAYYKKLNHNVNTILYAPPKAFTLPRNGLHFQNIINTAKTDSGKRFAFLRNYQKSVNISNSFAVYADKIFKYLYIIDVLRPIYYAGVNIDKLPAGYRNYVDSFKSMFTCDSCLLNESYRRASLNIRYYLVREFKQDNNRFSLCYDTIASSFTGTTRRYLLFMELKNHTPASSTNYENKYASFINEKDDIYSNYLIMQRTFANQFKIDDNAKKEISDVEGKKYTWEELLSKYKGYTIYLDFWASWCGPCRYNIALSEKLKMDFKDKKILFLDISIDHSPSEWQNAMLEEHMDKKLNYFLIDENNSSLNKRFKINSIPRYFIINKNGAIVDENAIYPNNSQINKVLTDYLNR